MQKWLRKHTAKKSTGAVKSRHHEVPEQQIAQSRVCSQKAARSTHPSQLAAASASSTRIAADQDCCGTSICYFRYCRQHSFIFLLFKTFFARQQLYEEKEKPSQVSPDAASHSTHHSRAISVFLQPAVWWQSTTAHQHTHRRALTLRTITSLQVMHSNSYSENQCHNIPTQTVQDQSTATSSKALQAIWAGFRATRNSEMRSQPLSPCKQKMRERSYLQLECSGTNTD